jgi:hypothetical protein
MADVWTYLILILVMVVFGAALRARQRPASVDNNPGRCTSCETPVSKRTGAAM